MFAAMCFMFFFFLGFVVMFYYLLRKLDNQNQLLSDEHAQLRVLLRAMESRLDQMERIGTRDATNAAQPATGVFMADIEENGSAGHDPLLHLSFEEPRIPGLNFAANQSRELLPDPGGLDPRLSAPQEKA